MNRGHRQLCASARWGRYIREDLVPWVVGDRPLGGSVLEIGPGPGLTTDALRSRTRHLTAVEADAIAAASLQARMTGANVTVVHADAVAMSFRSGRFTAGVAMTMLHHVPTVVARDALLAETRRVLRPGAWLLGVDSVDSPGFRAFHKGDVCVPIDRRRSDPGSALPGSSTSRSKRATTRSDSPAVSRRPTQPSR